MLSSLTGEVMQIPPKYSAKNINGRRGYDLARAGIEFELPPKKVRIDCIELIGKVEEKENTFAFKIRCGGGTYIRSIARDMGTALGTNAIMSALRRTQSGYFQIENALPFSLLEQDISAKELEKYIIPTERVLAYPSITLAGRTAERALNGLAVETEEKDGLYKLYIENTFYGLAQVTDNKVKAKTKLC